ncbi:unnamed protein product [Rhizophagus irregularis]|nr:unnamed protein product [Rhizophagus irregularis]
MNSNGNIERKTIDEKSEKTKKEQVKGKQEKNENEQMEQKEDKFMQKNQEEDGIEHVEQKEDKFKQEEGGIEHVEQKEDKFKQEEGGIEHVELKEDKFKQKNQEEDGIEHVEQKEDKFMQKNQEEDGIEHVEQKEDKFKQESRERDGIKREKDGTKREKEEEIKQEKEEIKQEKGEIKQEKGEIKREKEEIKREKKEIKQEKEEIKQEKEEIKQEKEEIKQEKEEIKLEKGEIKQVKEEIKQEKEEIKQVKKEIKQEKKEIKQVKEEIKQVKEVIKQVKEEIKQEKEEIKQEKEEIKQEKEEIKQEKEEIKQEKEEIKQVKEEIKRTMEEVKKQKDEEIRQLKEEIEGLNEKIAGYQLQNKSLNDENAELQNYIGKATTFSLSDDDRDHSVQFVKDIKNIQMMIENYVGILRPKVEINVEEINKLLRTYGCKARVKSKDSRYDTLLMKGALQRYVFELILEKTKNYTGIECRIFKSTNQIFDSLTQYLKECDGVSKVMKAYPIKMRQQIFGFLGSLGFADKDDKEHPFILFLTNELNDSINKLRTIEGQHKSKKHNDMAANLIREVIRMVYFRFRVQEPCADFFWVPYNEKINPDLMEGRWDDDIDEQEDIEEPAEEQVIVDDKFVELCTFPLINASSNIKDQKTYYTRAKVIHQIESESNYSKNEANDNSGIINTFINGISTIYLKSKIFSTSNEQIAAPTNNNVAENRNPSKAGTSRGGNKNTVRRNTRGRGGRR